ncbi:hypothetical protein NQD34_008625 [Periophthalmus magnuspinnatus]|nr:hypothetical protein NQD34_008625 [Periophthalmus magnuspinnatus]
MPRHLISAAHERMNEIPTVPIHHLVKPQRGTSTKGKKTLLSSTLVWHSHSLLLSLSPSPPI